MSQPAHPLSLQELLQVIRYELRFNREEMASECGLCPCCYDDLELRGDPEAEPTMVAAIHDQLPRLSTLLRLRQRQAGGIGFSERLSQLEAQTPAEREVELSRVRLELQWLESNPVRE